MLPATSPSLSNLCICAYSKHSFSMIFNFFCLYRFHFHDCFFFENVREIFFAGWGWLKPLLENYQKGELMWLIIFGNIFLLISSKKRLKKISEERWLKQISMFQIIKPLLHGVTVKKLERIFMSMLKGQLPCEIIFHIQAR